MIKQFRAKVVKVEEKRQAVRGTIHDRGLPTQRMEVEYESMGWWVTLEGFVAFKFGNEMPALKNGDTLQISMEIVND